MTEKPAHSRQASESGNSTAIFIVALAVCFVIGTLLFPDFVLIYAVAFFASLVVVARGGARNGGPATRNARSSDVELDPNSERNALADAFQHPVIIIDRSAVIKFANEASKSLFGEVRDGEQLFIRFRNPDLRRTIEKAISGGEAERIEYNQRVPTDRWYNVEIAPVPRGQPELFTISFHDFTEAKRIDQMRSDFIANASHELRTPLSSLIGYLQTLKGPAKKDPKASEKFVDIMLDQSERMARLVNDLLSLSKIEMKSHVKPSGTVDLVEIIDAVVNSLEKLARKMGVEIAVTSEGGSYQVPGDRDELMQVFENLIENGCKYGEEGGRVEVELKGDSVGERPAVLITVRDFGPGIPVEYQHRITERFYRVDVARSREKQGTGLGLAIVKHILQRHGTRLQVKSAPGEGSEFSVKLPLVCDVEN